MTSVVAVLGAVIASWGAVTVVREARSPTGDRQVSVVDRRDPLRVLVALASGAAVGVITRWPVAAIGAAGFAWLGRDLLGPDRSDGDQAELAEGLATWCEMLRDGLAGSAGLHRCIAATADVAPLPIRPQVQRLAATAEYTPLDDALTGFAADVAHPTADLVVASLRLTATSGAGHLARLLGTLAHAARDEAELRVRVAAGRARLYTSARIVTMTAVASVAALAVADRGLLGAYDSPGGQAVLGGITASWLGGLWWLRSMSRLDSPGRFLG